MTFAIKKIISGGQTGADMGALLAARDLGIESGGTAPKGWLTEDGPQEALLRGFGLVQCEENGYPERTRRNVVNSDATLLVGPYGRGGTRLTYDLAQELKKPLFLVAYPIAPDPTLDESFRDWLRRYNVQILNVAGNRESESPGIAQFTRDFLVNVLT